MAQSSWRAWRKCSSLAAAINAVTRPGGGADVFCHLKLTFFVSKKAFDVIMNRRLVK